MTAVEQFFKDLVHLGYIEYPNENLLQDRLNLALEMEKEQIKQQIMDAWDRGLYIGQIFQQGNIENIYEQDSEQYYSETYKKYNK